MREQRQLAETPCLNLEALLKPVLNKLVQELVAAVPKMLGSGSGVGGLLSGLQSLSSSNHTKARGEKKPKNKKEKKKRLRLSRMILALRLFLWRLVSI